ncbi:hypothetical protein M885DRAFT_532952 [Pelagophyceae sp. CCMP2097]|nr:hypothetical protein M885DRAFT_532952 [Pelagophyceae sp. CCMP2097]|mmetsp:Transcript_18871/g.63784  ORF Transcript_18871/g.63784 Transcript_18871/m.63784 type:complete len:355 (-) Transcript_18871:27-1091(-)
MVRVLVLGSGYVAQHLVECLRVEAKFKVTYTHRSVEAPFQAENVSSVRLDLTDADSVAKALWTTLPDVVVNAAAMASPAACEADPMSADAVNCPVLLMEALFACCPDALLIHFSTDIVLADAEDAHSDGGASVAGAKRAIDEAKPANVYGRSKLRFEKCLADAPWPRCIVLRCSNILGAPAPFRPDDLATRKFAQWLLSRFSAGGETKLWNDEFRNFVDIRQILGGVRSAIDRFGVAHVRTTEQADVEALVAATTPSETSLADKKARLTHPPLFLHLNAGGPDCLSRADVGRILACVVGVDADSAVVSAPRGFDCPYPSPLRVELDSANFVHELGVPLVPIRDALRFAFETQRH